jgi:hypothetical protein
MWSGADEVVMVMPADNAGLWVGYMAGKYEGRVGHLYSPGYERPPIPFLPYALDNGRFSCWSKGSEWNEAGYLAMLETHGAAALWCIVPDRVGNRDETLREWDRWAPRMSGLRLALAVQDGMTADDVPAEAAVVFVGGTTEWKRRTLHSWAERFRRVHVGRINTEKWLWECHAAGVESCDGTGWFRGDQVQFRGLLRYFDRSTRGVGPRQASLFEEGNGRGDTLGAARAAVRSDGQRFQAGGGDVEDAAADGAVCKNDWRTEGAA